MYARVDFQMIAGDQSAQRDAIHHMVCTAVNKLDDKPQCDIFDRSVAVWFIK